MFTIQSLKETVGFAHVDAHVTDVMVAWIGSVVMKTCQDMISTARTARVTTVTTMSCTGRGSRQGRNLYSVTSLFITLLCWLEYPWMMLWLMKTCFSQQCWIVSLYSSSSIFIFPDLEPSYRSDRATAVWQANLPTLSLHNADVFSLWMQGRKIHQVVGRANHTKSSDPP